MSANAETPQPAKGFKLRFSSKCPEGGGFGTIMLATLFYGRRAIWREAVFLPYDDTEVWRAFWDYEPEVFGSINSAEARRESMRSLKAQSSGWQR